MRQRRIKIAYVLTPITFGGAEQVALHLMRNLDRQSYEISPILLLRPWEPPPHFAVELQSAGLPFKTLPVAPSPKGGPLRVPHVAWRLFHILRHGRLDLLHTQGYFADICGLPAARLLAIPGLATCHGFIDNDRSLKAYNFMDKVALRLCKKVIAVSDSIKTALLESGIAEQRIAVIPNAVHADYSLAQTSGWQKEIRGALNIAGDDTIIGFLGRLSEEKGLHFLVEAVKALRDSGLAVTLLIVGEGPQQNQLEKWARDHNIEKNIRFVGFKVDACKWLSAMDIFVLPSLTEGTPMALLEAMALGIPTVTTAVGGVPKIIENRKNGLMVEPSSSAALRDAISLLLSDDALKERIGAAGRQTTQKKYNIDNWRRSIAAIYQEVV